MVYIGTCKYDFNIYNNLFIHFTCAIALKPDPRRSISPDGTRLFIRNVTRNDVQVFQCNASNIHGYAFKNAILNVLC